MSVVWLLCGFLALISVAESPGVHQAAEGSQATCHSRLLSGSPRTWAGVCVCVGGRFLRDSLLYVTLITNLAGATQGGTVAWTPDCRTVSACV